MIWRAAGPLLGAMGDLPKTRVAGRPGKPLRGRPPMSGVVQGPGEGVVGDLFPAVLGGHQVGAAGKLDHFGPVTVLPVHYEGRQHFQQGGKEAITASWADAPAAFTRAVTWLTPGTPHAVTV